MSVLVLQRKLFFSTVILFVAMFNAAPALSITSIEKTQSYYIDASVKSSEVISSVLSTDTENTDTYSLFTHGRPGQLYIDGQWQGARAIASILADELSEQSIDGQITQLNVYGCEFAKGDKGLDAVAYLEEELGVKVNASNNITGRDGDWLLEVGNIRMNEFQGYSFNLQLDDTHYIPPFTSEFGSNSNNANYLYLSTPSTTPITVTVTDAGGTPIDDGSGTLATMGQYVISKGSPYALNFGNTDSAYLHE